MFGLGLTYETKEAKECLWEAHRKYLDIYEVLDGEEYVYIADISKMNSIKDEDDYELFEGDKEHRILLKAGYFLLLYPNEVHKAGITANTSNFLKKKVFKYN